MKSLGETYKRGSKANKTPQSTRVPPRSEQPPPITAPSGGTASPASRADRGTIYVGDVIAVLFGILVFCFGVILWVSPEIGLFGGGFVGIRRLAELTTGLGIDAIVIWVLVIHSRTQRTRRPHSLATSGLS